MLAQLERARERILEQYTVPDELTVVLHDTAAELVLSNPLLPPLWAVTARPARRYLTGWAGINELHVLSPKALRERATSVSGSFEMLALAPVTQYAKRVVLGANRELQAARLPARSLAELRWAWLIDGTARWLAGESDYSRRVVGQYLRSGHRPRFPPSAHDAPLLAPILIAMIAEQEGAATVARLAGRLHSNGAQAALRGVLSGERLLTIENDWRARLRGLAEVR